MEQASRNDSNEEIFHSSFLGIAKDYTNENSSPTRKKKIKSEKKKLKKETKVVDKEKGDYYRPAQKPVVLSADNKETPRTTTDDSKLFRSSFLGKTNSYEKPQPVKPSKKEIKEKKYKQDAQKIEDVQHDYDTLATTPPTSETRPKPDIVLPKGHEKYGRFDKTDAEVEKIADEISRNINKQIKREEREAKKAQNAKNRKISKPKELTRVRFTEPKKRLLISRIHLINKYDRGSYSDIKRWIKKGELTFEEVEDSRTSKNWFDRGLYKEVREYEDVMDDVKLRRGWRAFKAGIGAVMLATCIALPTAYIDKYTNLTPTTPTPITYEVASETNKEQARELIESIKEASGYDFANLSEIQMIDTVLRMPMVINNNSERSFDAAFMRFEDQKKLDHMLYVGLGETYADFTYEQKLDLRQLTYELIGTMGEEGITKQKYLRSPMKVEELITNYNLVSQGELPSKGGVANPGAVAGYGVTSGWNGEKVIIKRDKTGGIIIEDVTKNLSDIGETIATNETISSDNTINNDQVTNNDEMGEERV